MTIIIAILVFGVIILVHELGHFLAARAVGITVEEFSIGFGPRLTGFKASGTNFSIRGIPLGGYVKMLGEDPQEQGLPDQDDANSFQSKTPLQRMAVIAAGPVMNFILAVLLFILIFGALGVYHYLPQIGEVMPDSPAEQAGLMDQDEILAIDGQPIEEWQDVQQQIQLSEADTLRFTILRQGQQMEVDVQPQLGENDIPQVGISPLAGEIVRLPLGESIVRGFQETVNMTVAVWNSLVGIITRQISTDELTGPIGIVYFVGEAARMGAVSVLSLAALISVNLGLFNLLPIPALDGSKLLFLTIEMVRRRPVDPEKEGIITLVGFALLITLMVVVMYRDIVRYIF